MQHKQNCVRGLSHCNSRARGYTNLTLPYNNTVCTSCVVKNKMCASQSTTPAAETSS